MRIAVDMLGVETNHVKQLANALKTLFLGANAMDGHGLRNDLANGHARVQARVRILEDELHIATHILELFFTHG